MTEKEIRAAMRAVRSEMKALGIKRSSCFNGGHSGESYRLNAELFRLGVLLERAQGKPDRF